MDDRVAQVQVVVVRGGKILLLKRSEAAGGFWQPITGGVNPGEEPAVAARRELSEETGINEIVRLVDDNYYFDFTEQGITMREHVFGIEVAHDTEPTLSEEHVEYRWVDLDDALALMKWDSNKASVLHMWHRM